MNRRDLGRYTLYDEIASGGMATVFLARARGEAGFKRLVAIKKLHPQYAKQDEFRAMFLDEANLVSRIRHRNVVATLDVLEVDTELFLVMEYVAGESLSHLLGLARERNEPVPLGVVSAIIGDVLEGLHAAHEATAIDGSALDIVHRDVSPQNVLVGVDGVAHVADFGLAKAAGRLAEKFSVPDTIKGKAGYMAPEQIRGSAERRSDVYATGVMLWEMLTGERLFEGDSFLAIVTKSLDAVVPAPSRQRSEITPAVDAVVKRALAHTLRSRFATAREFTVALEEACPRAPARAVTAWIEQIAGDSLRERRERIAEIEADVVVAPSNEASAVEIVATPIRRRGLAWAAASFALVLAGAAIAFMRWAPHEPRATANVAIAVSPDVPSASATPVFAPPVVDSADPAPSSKPRSSRAAPRAATPPRASASTTKPCTWVELPDEQGILIPKKVCP